jgi:hypothetical protein
MPEFLTITPIEDITLDDLPGLCGPEGPWEDDEVIDTILRLVSDHHRALGAAIGRRSFSPTLAELRQSPLGQDLRLLATADLGDINQVNIRETASRVTDLLLRPLAAEGMTIPAWFWTTAIGRMVARATRASYADEELMPVSDAADRLGVPPALITAWTVDGSIAMVPDDAGRPLVPRSAIEKRRHIARELIGLEFDGGEDVLLREQRIAS